MSEGNNYSANDIKTLSPGRSFRDKLGMYLSADRQEAINLGLRELIVNVQDEYEVFKPKNPLLKIELNTNLHEIRVSDNMRGIPVGVRADGINSLTAAFLIPHSGGKHEEGAYCSSVGINGEGNKVVCHTSKWLEVEVHRDSNVYFQRFESDDEGAHAIEEVRILHKCAQADTGTIITYVPDEKVYQGKFIDIDALDIMLTEMSYFTKGLKILLVVDGDEKVYFSQNGLMDGLKTDDAIGKPFNFFYEQDGCKVELALQWVAHDGEIKGYANGLFMPQGGAFISGFKSSLTKVFNGLCGQHFDGESIRKFLDGFVSVKVKVGQFSNQAKTSLANQEARTATSAAITLAIKQYVAENQNDFNKVVALLNKVAHADAVAERARNAVLNHEKKEMEVRRKCIIMPEKFKDCEKHGQDSMLIICEGNSAVAGLMPARNVKTEALYGIRGKIINSLKSPLDETLQNQEVSDIISILGCGIQQNYSSRKLNYGKVAIAADADADGKNIMCLLVTMFMTLMPTFIYENRLCWLRAPLYRLEKGDKKIFAYDDEELNELKKTHSGWIQGRNKGLGEMSADDMRQSMLHPTERRLDILTINDKDAAFDTLNLLMGEEVKPRRDYLFENADFKTLMDVQENEVMNAYEY